MKILVFSTLYPNSVVPQHGIFVENRLRKLLAQPGYSARVVAPVPWFPFKSAFFGRYGAYARVPRKETRHGIEIDHPRYPLIPKLGTTLAPFLLYFWVRGVLRGLLRDGFDFDLIDAHYGYPDGVTAVLLGRRMNRAVTVTTHGSDINVITELALPRRLLRWALRRASAITPVSTALRDRIAALGVDESKLVTIPNGVDLVHFRPVDRCEARRRFGVKENVLATVGNLLPAKGQRVVVEALARLPETTLLIAGAGPDESALRDLVSRLGLVDRVRFLGRMPHEDLCDVYNAADVTILASEREGWPSVLLESMACGTPVIATDVGGIPEIVQAHEAGMIVRGRNVDAVASAVDALLADPPDRAATRRYAETFSWDATTEAQVALFRRIVEAP